MKRIKNISSVNSVILEIKSDNDDIDILVDNYHKFKRGIDYSTHKLKKLSLINNSGNPLIMHKVSNFILVKNRKVYLDIEVYIGDNYLIKIGKKKLSDMKQKKITDN
ncbi:hypothetical protein ABXT43_00855 [Candidatus Pelagibacter sp. Uisw_114]